MLVIRFKGWSVKLDHQVGSAGKFGIWSFHGSESSYAPDMQTILRHAAIRPAEPAEGGEVEVFICDARMAQDEWRAVGKGVAAYELDRRDSGGILGESIPQTAIHEHEGLCSNGA